MAILLVVVVAENPFEDEDVIIFKLLLDIWVYVFGFRAGKLVVDQNHCGTDFTLCRLTDAKDAIKHFNCGVSSFVN